MVSWPKASTDRLQLKSNFLVEYDHPKGGKGMSPFFSSYLNIQEFSQDTGNRKEVLLWKNVSVF